MSHQTLASTDSSRSFREVYPTDTVHHKNLILNTLSAIEIQIMFIISFNMSFGSSGTSYFDLFHNSSIYDWFKMTSQHDFWIYGVFHSISCILWVIVFQLKPSWIKEFFEISLFLGISSMFHINMTSSITVFCIYKFVLHPSDLTIPLSIIFMMINFLPCILFYSFNTYF